MPEILVFFTYGMYIAPVILFLYFIMHSKFTCYYGIYFGSMVSLWGIWLISHTRFLSADFFSMAVLTILGGGIISGSLKSLDWCELQGQPVKDNQLTNQQSADLPLQHPDIDKHQKTFDAPNKLTPKINEYQMPIREVRTLDVPHLITSRHPPDTRQVLKCRNCNTAYEHLVSRGRRRCLLCSGES